MARSKSSGQWLKEHFNDEFVKQARLQGFRSRAVFKLKEIDERDGVFRKGMRVVDLGAAPGSWSQYALTQVGETGQVIAVDILTMDAIPGVDFLCGDFREEHVLRELFDRIDDSKLDVVVSDMSPNSSGMDVIDQPRSMYLAELALDTARQTLAAGGTFLVKIFQGVGFDPFHKNMRQLFKTVTVRKPKASRPRSREQYLLAKGFKSDA